MRNFSSKATQTDRPAGMQAGPVDLRMLRPASLTSSVLRPLHPRERDGAFPGALTEPKQERPRLLVLEQSAFSLLADKTHDAPGH